MRMSKSENEMTAGTCSSVYRSHCSHLYNHDRSTIPYSLSPQSQRDRGHVRSGCKQRTEVLSFLRQQGTLGYGLPAAAGRKGFAKRASRLPMFQQGLFDTIMIQQRTSIALPYLTKVVRSGEYEEYAKKKIPGSPPPFWLSFIGHTNLAEHR